MTDFIPLCRPDITDDDVRLVSEAIRSGRLSQGPMLEQFEEAVAQRAGRKHGIGVSSGTAGLHLAMVALNIGPGDEVITPAFSFIASANCIEYVGAKPVFVDCDPGSLNMDLKQVEEKITEKTRAIIGVEVFGNPSGMPELAALSRKYEIPLVEDACEGLGGAIDGDPVGGFGRIAVFGFYPNKQITTGEGGMIVTSDDRTADVCRALRNQGRPPASTSNNDDQNQENVEGLGNWLDHQLLGYNYRLSELSAAMGASQIKRLNQLIEQRELVASAYTRRLGANTEIVLPTIESNITMSWFVYVVRLIDRFTFDDRDAIIEGLRRHEVGASNYFPPIPLQPYYRRKYGYKPGDFPCCESISHRTIALPFFPGLTEREVDLVAQTLEVMIMRRTFARS